MGISWKDLWFPPLNLFNWPKQNITFKYKSTDAPATVPRESKQRIIERLLKDR